MNQTATISTPRGCPGVLQWPNSTSAGHFCPVCGQQFTRGELQGRDDHLPPHIAASATPRTDAAMRRADLIAELAATWEQLQRDETPMPADLVERVGALLAMVQP